MRNIGSLNSQLLKSDFDTAKDVYEASRGQGFGPLQAAALTYRHGFLDGKALQKRKTDDAYKKLYEITRHQGRPPEADTGELTNSAAWLEEGSADNE